MTNKQLAPSPDYLAGWRVLNDFCKTVAKKTSFWAPLLLFSVMGYGFSMMNRTISTDDLRFSYYTDPHQAGISGGRWGNLVLQKLLGFVDTTPFTAKFIGVLFLIGSGIVLCALLFYLNGRRTNVMPYTLFASLLVTFPLINEIWEYTGANAITAITLFLSCCTILFLITCKQKSFKVFMLAAIPMTLVVSSYEVGLFAYVTLVCMVLFYRLCFCSPQENSWKTWIMSGLSFVVPLLIGFVFRILIEIALLRIYNVTYSPVGAVEIAQDSSLVHLLKDLLVLYGLAGLVYFPITIFVVAAVVFFVFSVVRSVRSRSILPLVQGLAVLISIFLQSFLQRQPQPYRTALELSLFVAFTAFILLEACAHIKKRHCQQLCCVGLFMLCWHQSVYLNHLLELNNLRSDNELATVRALGTKIVSEYDTGKPIAFVGSSNHLGNYIKQYVSIEEGGFAKDLFLKYVSKTDYYRFVQSNVNSCIEWSMGVDHMMKTYFSYCGFDFRVVDPEANKELYESLWLTAIGAKMQKYQVMDAGDFLIVCMGDL